jgi:secondary thiamine-phosphate synthase enzyme
VEAEEGVYADIKNVLEEITPEHRDWEHHKKWGDKNGAAHIRAALIGPDVVVPVENGEILLGTWQQIVLIDFDENSREREVIITPLPNRQP